METLELSSIFLCIAYMHHQFSRQSHQKIGAMRFTTVRRIIYVYTVKKYCIWWFYVRARKANARMQEKISLLKLKLCQRKREYLNNLQTRDFMKRLHRYFEFEVEVPRIRIGKKQTIETLINEEACMHARNVSSTVLCMHMPCRTNLDPCVAGISS